MKRTFLLVVFLSGYILASANDSLYNVLDTAKNEVRVNTLNQLAKNLINNEPQKALDHTREALELSVQLDYKRGIASCYNNLGVLYKNQGVLDKALDYYIKSLELNELIGNSDGVALTKANIGNIYSLKGDHDKAIEYFMDTYNAMKEADSKSQLVGVLNNLGNAYLNQGDQDKALEYFTQAVDMYEELGQKNQAFDPLNSLGNIYFYREEFDKAIDYYSLSLLIEEDNNNKFGQAYAHNNIGVAFMLKKDLINAEKHETRALNIANEINAQPLLMEIYKSLSETYYAQKRVDLAYQTRLLYDQTKDFVSSQESSRKLARLEVAFELSEHEKAIEIAKKENTITQLEDQQNRTLIIVVIMGAMLLVAFLFIYISLKRRNKEN